MAKYGLIGKSLIHSQSKNLHELIEKYQYDLIEVCNEEELREVLKDTSYDGFNVTIPYKETVIKYLDEISVISKDINAVNVIKRTPEGKLYGYNTDIDGFMHLVGDRAKGRKCFVMGTGGAARAAALGLEMLGAESVKLVSRNPESAKSKLGKEFPIITYTDFKHCYDAQVIVNATPVGTIPNNDQTPMQNAMESVRVFENLEFAIDLIYNPYRTKFLQDCRRINGCKTISGLEMLLFQAIEARNLWMGEASDRLEKKFEEGTIKKRILKNQLNIVSIGMPGSGKTTIFRRYARELGMPFIDIDEETEKLMGDTIENVLKDKSRGEEYFREMEHQAIKNACKGTGSVIATGGGSILNPLNRDLIRSNGIVIYMRRPLDKLAVKNRPISQEVGVEELYKERDRIYRRTADFTITNSHTFGAKKAETGEGDSYIYEMKKFVYTINKRVEVHYREIASNKWT